MKDDECKVNVRCLHINIIICEGMNEFSHVGYLRHLKVEGVPAHRQRCGVGVEDVKTELLEGLLEDNIHHGVLLPIFCLQVIDLH